jgi:methylmalonyl-CoA/ethylmalonyl-CoA epimerase
MKILELDHVSIATDDLNKHGQIFENLFCIKAGKINANPANKINLSFVDLGNADLEFIQPLDRESPIFKFLEKRGPGIHHICLLVEDIDQALEELTSKNIKLLDKKPRIGAEGSRIALIHPESAGGILIELKEESK